jgi:N-acyl-D-amino-acid deacylase
MADLLVVDEREVTEQATAERPTRLASGFSYVAVNGTLVLDGSEHTGETPGQAIRASARVAVEAVEGAA